jgi:hypothetical protein
MDNHPIDPYQSYTPQNQYYVPQHQYYDPQSNQQQQQAHGLFPDANEAPQPYVYQQGYHSGAPVQQLYEPNAPVPNEVPYADYYHQIAGQPDMEKLNFAVFLISLLLFLFSGLRIILIFLSIGSTAIWGQRKVVTIAQTIIGSIDVFLMFFTAVLGFISLKVDDIKKKKNAALAQIGLFIALILLEGISVCLSSASYFITLHIPFGVAVLIFGLGSIGLCCGTCAGISGYRYHQLRKIPDAYLL